MEPASKRASARASNMHTKENPRELEERARNNNRVPMPFYLGTLVFIAMCGFIVGCFVFFCFVSFGFDRRKIIQFKMRHDIKRKRTRIEVCLLFTEESVFFPSVVRSFLNAGNIRC